MMPPKDDVSSGALPKGVCGSCAARFYSKQQFFVCSAGCSRKFHCKCLNVGLVEYNTYMETGTTTFMCSGCTRRCSLSPKAARASTSVNNENLNDMDGESASAQESQPFPASFMRVLETLSGKLDILTAEFQCLRAENRSLRSEVLQLRKNVLDRIPLIPSSRPLYATVTGLPPATPTPVPNSPPRSAWLPQNVQHQPSSTLRQEKHPGQTTSHPDEVSAVERDFPMRNFGLNGLQSANTVDDGFVPVKSRRRVKPSSGTAKPDKCCPLPIRPSRRKSVNHTLWSSRSQLHVAHGTEGAPAPKRRSIPRRRLAAEVAFLVPEHSACPSQTRTHNTNPHRQKGGFSLRRSCPRLPVSGVPPGVESAASVFFADDRHGT
ncbi:uncharacterized protein ISCGN_009854 [Ixodes scapularis]